MMSRSGEAVSRSVRYFVFEEEGTLKSIARQTVDALIQQNDAIPSYAKTRQRAAVPKTERCADPTWPH
jgi:hypothetical protein